jgi:tRNA threonylcarbamoyladenosine biosynthesis protein TsaB
MERAIFMNVVGTPSEILLAMETSGDVCSVAVLRNGLFTAEHTFRHGMHLSERLMTHLEQVLQDADTTLEQVGAFAVGIGPGSFTGTRIGVMTMKTLASVQEKPLVGICGLDAMASVYTGLQAVIVTPILPCRAGVVYACPFQVDGSRPNPLAEPAAFPLEELAVSLSALPFSSFLFCGPAVSRYEAALREALPEDSRIVSFGRADFPHASAVGALAYAHLAAGLPSHDPIDLTPLYISPPPISTPKKENRPPELNLETEIRQGG